MTVENREAGARIHGLWNAAKGFEKEYQEGGPLIVLSAQFLLLVA